LYDRSLLGQSTTSLAGYEFLFFHEGFFQQLRINRISTAVPGPETGFSASGLFLNKIEEVYDAGDSEPGFHVTELDRGS
jgi:hypothetical protein